MIETRGPAMREFNRDKFLEIYPAKNTRRLLGMEGLSATSGRR